MEGTLGREGQGVEREGVDTAAFLDGSRAHQAPFLSPPPLLPQPQVLFETQGRSRSSKAVDLEDMKFHQCVRLARFENDRTISFIPPDGHFDLMNYRLSQVMRGGGGGWNLRQCVCVCVCVGGGVACCLSARWCLCLCPPPPPPPVMNYRC